MQSPGEWEAITPAHIQREVIAATKVRVDALSPEMSAGACLYWASETVRELSRRGTRAIIQAGSASWPRVRPEDDDGIIDTHFGYVFERSDRDRERFNRGLLPELHCWAAIPDTGELIDLTTGYQMDQARETAALDWPAPELPPYYWGRVLPERWYYKPDLTAITLVLHLLHSQSQEDGESHDRPIYLPPKG